MVSDLLKQVESGAKTPTIILPPTFNSRERVETILSKFKDGKIPSLSEKTTAKEAPIFILEIEKQSFNHYSQVAEDAENNETADV